MVLKLKGRLTFISQDHRHHRVKNLHQPSDVSSCFVVCNQEEVQQLLNVLHLAGLLNIETLFLFQLGYHFIYFV